MAGSPTKHWRTLRWVSNHWMLLEFFKNQEVSPFPQKKTLNLNLWNTITHHNCDPLHAQVLAQRLCRQPWFAITWVRVGFFEGNGMMSWSFFRWGKALWVAMVGDCVFMFFHSKTLLTHLCHDSVSTQIVTRLIEQICVSSRWKGKKFMACPRVTVVEDRFFPAVVKQISKLFHWIFLWNWIIFQCSSKCRVFFYLLRDGYSMIWYYVTYWYYQWIYI